jgi:hypothetical protein
VDTIEEVEVVEAMMMMMMTTTMMTMTMKVVTGDIPADQDDDITITVEVDRRVEEAAVGVEVEVVGEEGRADRQPTASTPTRIYNWVSNTSASATEHPVASTGLAIEVKADTQMTSP